MTVPGSPKKLFLAAFAAIVILHAIAVSSSRLLPFTDLPNHLASSTIARYYGEPGNEFTRYYSVDLFPKPNVIHIVFCSLKIFRSVETANRAWYFLYALLLPLSALLLTRRLGGVLWPSAFSLLLLYNYSVNWGFAGYTMAVPLVLLSAWVSAGIAMKGGARLTAASVSLLLLTFFAHALAALFAVVLHIAFMAGARNTRPARKAARCLAALPALAILAAWWLYGRSFWFGQSISDHLAGYYSGEFFATFPNRWKLLFIDNYNLFDGAAGIIVGTAFSLIIIAVALIPLVSKRHGKSAKPEGMRYAMILLSISLACYLFLPKGIPGQEVLAQRFSVFVLLSLTVVAGVAWKDHAPRLIPAAAIAVCAVHLFLWWNNFNLFNRENEGFTPAFFPDRGKGKILSGMIYNYRRHGQPAYIHYPGYYITWKKGIATTSVVGYRFGAVRRKASLAVLPQYLEWIGRAGGYDGRYDHLEYLLVRGDAPAGRESETEGFVPIRSAGKWLILKND